MGRELFIRGNPRYLSGGTGPVRTNYEDPPATADGIAEQPAVTTRRIDSLYGEAASTAQCLKTHGQAVYQGKVPYHSTPPYNRFLRDGEWPSAGVEIETIVRKPDPAFADAAKKNLKSNWFHFERDGSLDRAHGGEYGYELITVPLPPRVYRNLDTWTGLQNICSPYLSSFESKETGLHVHVGVNQFEDFPIPVMGGMDRRMVGKLLSAIVYYCAVDMSFIDRVVLRRMTEYCNNISAPIFTDASKLLASGRATGARLVDYCVSRLLVNSPMDWYRKLTGNDASTGPDNWISSSPLPGGHAVEINCQHMYTIEFRRAKGTLHALSVHRIVELMTSIVRFAGKLCREPDFVVTRDSFMEWLAQTTTSRALKSLAQQMKG